jgi:Domain of unknown function (DUF4783)
MKLLYLSLLLLSPFVLQNNGDPIEKTAALLRSANIDELSQYFASTVDITMKGEEASYPGAEAKVILANFFAQNQPKAVKILHRITSSAKFNYGVVILTTDNGVYRVAFSLKNNKGKFELTELRFEVEKAK